MGSSAESENVDGAERGGVARLPSRAKPDLDVPGQEFPLVWGTGCTE